jgi:rhamnosyltransferase
VLKICSIIITKDPDQDFPLRIQRIGASVQDTIIVDNGSDIEHRKIIDLAGKPVNTHILWNDFNLGVATALNLGIVKAIDLGCDWALLMDQDSEPAEDMVEKLCISYDNSVEKEKIAIIVPRIIDKDIDRESPFLRQKTRWLYERVLCEDVDLPDITTAITSGALLNLQRYKTIGKFREDFFIDYVDTDFCLRSRLLGFRILASCQSKLIHQFGSRRRINSGPLTLYPSFHPPERWYTISRNRIPMLRDFALQFPHWLIYELVASTYITLRMLLTEDRKLDKISGIIRGTFDGLRGKLGPPSWANDSLDDKTKVSRYSNFE